MLGVISPYLETGQFMAKGHQCPHSKILLSVIGSVVKVGVRLGSEGGGLTAA